MAIDWTPPTDPMSIAAINYLEKDNDLKPFQDELTSLLNRYSCESVSGTPDFILAEYLVECLKTYNEAVSKRAEWYGGHAEFKPSLGVPND